MTRRIAFVGPLPPPVNGFSNICGMMLALLQKDAAVDVFDRAPRQSHRWLWPIEQLLLKPSRFLRDCVLHGDTTLYLALSGGRGQLVDLIYLLMARLFGRSVFVHHHSFAYINAPTALSRLFHRLSAAATHIVLSRGMGDSLRRVYQLERRRIRPVSNAAFYGHADGSPEAEAAEARPLSIGYLSNITFDKGFVEFFGTLHRLDALHVDYRAHIAGPIAADARREFERLMVETPRARYLGPLYGEAKDRFYHELDIFLFPTNYPNEAEPLVVYEALRSGVFVIACDRGAIGEMLGNGAGAAFARGVIVQAASETMVAFNQDRAALKAARASALCQARRIRDAGKTELESLLSSMQGRAGPDSLVGQI